MFYIFHETIIICLILFIITPKLPLYYRIILWGVFILFYNKSINILFTIIRVIIMGNLSINKKITDKIITNTYNNLFHFCHNFRELPQINTIFVANHPHNPLDYAAFKMIPKKVAIVAGGLHFLVRWTCDKNDYILFNNNKGKNFSELKDKIKDKIKHMSILVFVENYKSVSLTDSGRKIARLRSGIFSIAKDLNIPVTPLVIDRIHESWGRVHEQPFRMKIGKTFMVTNPKLNSLQTHKFMKLSKKLMESYK